MMGPAEINQFAGQASAVRNPALAATQARVNAAEMQPNGGGMIPTSRVVQGTQTFVPPGTQMGATIPPPQQEPVPPQAPLTPQKERERLAKQPERIQSLRKEFNDVPEVKNYRTVLPIIESARNAPNTAAGDIDLIYAVGKIMDPNSVVREGELNLVIKAGSPIQRFQGQVANIAGGGRLPPSQRQQLMTILDSRVGQAETAYNNAVNLYTRSAQSEGLPVDQIIQVTPTRRAGDKKDKASVFSAADAILGVK